MATRFMRIDLTDEARDFRPMALEPGVPLLDRSNANAKILFRWLGGMVAEPVWEGDSVNFFVRDDHGGRLEEVVCQPATADDLKKLLQTDLAALKERIAKAKPDTPTERALKKMIRQSFEQLTEDPHRTDLDNFFFKYRDVNGRWRLVWCWGYQRVDEQPAPAVVCTDDECSLLFVRRPGQSPKCPACEALLATRPRKKKRWKKVLRVMLLLGLLAAGLVYWYLHPNRLIATPETFSGPVGSRVEFKIENAGLFPFLNEDVTSQAVGVVLDPGVARFNQVASAATIVGTGTTLVRFHLGDLKPADVTLIAGLARNPDRVVIEPGAVELGIGTTARLKLVGQYDDGTEIDLTDAAQWIAQSDETIYAYEGLLEGVGEGQTTVAARYRANPQSEYLDATATVTVANIEFKAIEMGIDPLPVGVARASNLRIDAVSNDDKRYSVLESSWLQTEIQPQYLAAVEGRHIKGKVAGQGTIAVKFGDDLTGGMPFSVALGPGLDKLTVKPDKLEMVVGQITDLNIVSPSRAPIYVRSSDSALLEITDEKRLIGRAEGTVDVEVIQGNQKRTVPVTIATAEFASIAVDPARVVVPVDDTVRPRVLATLAGEAAGRRVEIAPDLLACEKRPSPRYADFDDKSMKLHGVAPTDPSLPQTLAMRFGRHGASAPVEVVVAPFRLALTPAGPVDLPLGQQMRLQGWATYSGGRRVGVPPGRIRLASQAGEDSVPGLQLDGDKVAALKPNAGPLNVYADYFGRKSKPVVFNSVEAGDVTLRLDVDRTLRLTGESGLVTLRGSDPQGDVDLVLSLSEFKSSDPAVVKIDEKTGAFLAVAPGEATITGNHLAAKNPANLTLKVYDPNSARLVFDPPSVRVAVDEMAELRLLLQVQDDAGKVLDQAALFEPEVGYSVTRPDAIYWEPPTLIGAQPTAACEINASLHPILSRIATARIEVVAAVGPTVIRIVPSNVTLAPGQTLPLRVEQQLPDAPEVWKEVYPSAVAWQEPPGLIWTPPAGELCPTVTVPEGATGDFELRAEFGGKRAMGVITLKEKGPNVNDPDARVLLVREPPGEYVPVGGQQRYSIVVEKDDAREPAADIQWPGDFENEFVRWQAPVLTAKRKGYRQWFRAEVDGRTVLFHTSTSEPSQFVSPRPREGAPVAVRILSDQDQPVGFPVGARFDDFYVEAEYPNGFVRIVTKKATLRTPQPPESAPLTASGGRLIGVRPGETTVSAEFDGVSTKQPLQAVVTANVDVDRLAIVPTPITILPGETIPIDVVGYKNGRSVGVLTGLGGVSWQSGNPQIARVDGSSVTGVALGQGTVTAQLGGLLSQPAPVNVVGSIAGSLVIDPQRLRLGVGQSMQIGTQVTILRGDMDLSRQCSVTSALPDVVQYVPQTHSLVGISPGASPVTFAAGGKLSTVTVEVLPGGGPIDGEVVVEPSTGTLAPGQALDMRVYVVTPDGRRIDRTYSAVLTSSDPGAVTIRGNNLACANGPGTATVTAVLPGTQQTGTAYVSVNNEQISALTVDPPQLSMYTGEVRRLRILGQAPSGTHEMFAHPDLTVTPAGANPNSIMVNGTEVSAMQSGQASLQISWQNRATQQVPVTVSDDVITGLQIDPANTAIHGGQAIRYQVTAVRGGQRRPVGPEDGVMLFPSDPRVAQVLDGLTVGGAGTGRTTIVAQFGGQQAEAALTVTPGDYAALSTTTIGTDGTVVLGGDYLDRHGLRYDNVTGWDAIMGRPVVDGGVQRIGLSAAVAGLRFEPEVLRLPEHSLPSPVRVIEVLADGTFGRDVTADPGLELSEPTGVVTLEKTAAGPMLRPVAPGQTRIGARLGTLTSQAPLLVSVGDYAVGQARLRVAPQPLTLWAGETGTFIAVMVDPGGGQMPFEIDYTVTPADNQNIVAATGGRMIRGVSNGMAQVVVTAVDPSGTYNGLSTTALVDVTNADQLSITPSTCDLQVGQPTPPFSVMAHPVGGQPYRVSASLQSLDPVILAPDSLAPDRFVGGTFGQTQVVADYRGRQAVATVTVSGKRFLEVIPTSVDETAADFEVTLRVLAAPSEAPLQYRVYSPGDTLKENWTDAQMTGGNIEASLRSPRIARGPYGMQYHLVLEARRPDGSTQKYQYKFQLVSVLKETEGPSTTPNITTPF